MSKRNKDEEAPRVPLGNSELTWEQGELLTEDQTEWVLVNGEGSDEEEEKNDNPFENRERKQWKTYS